MKCKNCGEELQVYWQFCPKCKTPVNVQMQEKEKNVAMEQNNKPTIEKDGKVKKNTQWSYISMAILCIPLAFVNPFFIYFAFIILMLGAMNNSKNRIIKIVCGVFLVIMGVGTVYMLLSCNACVNIIEDLK